MQADSITCAAIILPEIAPFYSCVLTVIGTDQFPS